MEETIEVTAEVIEPCVALEVVHTPATITDNLAALDSYVESQLQFYKGFHLDPDDKQQLKTARAVMAELNKLKEPIDSERKRIKREYEAPLRAFEDKVKSITSKIDDARAQIKSQVDEADTKFKEQRKAHLHDEYVGIAGVLADVIPFESILDAKWLNRSKAEGAAEYELQERAVSALKGYETLLSKNLNHKDEVIKKYVDTFDLLAALELEDELNDKDRQMAEFKAKQEAARAVKEQQAPEAEQQTAEAQPFHDEPESRCMKLSEEAAGKEAPVCLWSLNMEFRGNREFAQLVASTLKGLGVTGATIKNLGVVSNG